MTLRLAPLRRAKVAWSELPNNLPRSWRRTTSTASSRAVEGTCPDHRFSSFPGEAATLTLCPPPHACSLVQIARKHDAVRYIQCHASIRARSIAHLCLVANSQKNRCLRRVWVWDSISRRSKQWGRGPYQRLARCGSSPACLLYSPAPAFPAQDFRLLTV